MQSSLVFYMTRPMLLVLTSFLLNLKLPWLLLTLYKLTNSYKVWTNIIIFLKCGMALYLDNSVPILAFHNYREHDVSC